MSSRVDLLIGTLLGVTIGLLLGMLTGVLMGGVYMEAVFGDLFWQAFALLGIVLGAFLLVVLALGVYLVRQTLKASE